MAPDEAVLLQLMAEIEASDRLPHYVSYSTLSDECEKRSIPTDSIALALDSIAAPL